MEHILLDAFLQKLDTLPMGYSTGLHGGRRYGTTLTVSEDGRRVSLYAEELGGNDHVSFNLYSPRTGKVTLKPCEMPQEKVIDFVLNYKPDG